MRVGNFSLMIPQGRERDSGHVGLAPAAHYQIRLMNHLARRCDVDVAVDGKAIGTFRLNAHGSASLDGPPDDAAHGKFTFFEVGSDEAHAAGQSGIANQERGLIVATFKPERPYVHVAPAMLVGRSEPEQTWAPYRKGGPSGQHCNSNDGGGAVLRSAVSASYSTQGAQYAAGVTGVSGYTDQRFVNCGPIVYDENEITTITVRLGVDRAVAAVRPLQAAPKHRANPVPDPVG